MKTQKKTTQDISTGVPRRLWMWW